MADLADERWQAFADAILSLRDACDSLGVAAPSPELIFEDMRRTSAPADAVVSALEYEMRSRVELGLVRPLED